MPLPPGFVPPVFNAPYRRHLRYAIAGGGYGACIGEKHARAIGLTLRAQMVSGAFSQDPERSAAFAPRYGVSPDQSANRSFADLIAVQYSVLDFVVITTPNHAHYQQCRAAILAGLNVACDQPLCLTADEADALVRLVEQHKVVFCCTFHNTGYAMVRLAREMWQQGEFGQFVCGDGTYPQGWLLGRPEKTGQKQAAWATDPSRSGESGGYGDIGGSHTYHLATYILGQRAVSVRADLETIEPGRRLNDHGRATYRFHDGRPFDLLYSQVSAERLDDLSIRLYGTTGSCEWRQTEPNRLIVRRDGIEQVYHQNAGAPWAERYPLFHRSCYHLPGRPEGWFEAMAQTYELMFDAMGKRQAGGIYGVDYGCQSSDLPDVYQACHVQHALAAGIQSSRAGGVSTPI